MHSLLQSDLNQALEYYDVHNKISASVMEARYQIKYTNYTTLGRDQVKSFYFVNVSFYHCKSKNML